MHQDPQFPYRPANGRTVPAGGRRATVAQGWPCGKRVPQRLLVDFTRSFAVMTSARLPLLQALGTAAGTCRHARMKAVLEGVRQGVQRGRSLSDSLALYPEVFDRLYVHLTRVGEAAGVLEQMLLRLAVHLEKTAALKRKLRLALVYPGLILCVAAGATAFLLAVVVPTFAAMFADFGAALPAPTRFVLAASRALSTHLPALVGLAALTLAGLSAAGRTPRGRLVRDRLVLKVPFVGPLLLKSLVARFCRTLGTLLTSGVPLTEALALLAGASGNRHVEQEVGGILARVRRGSGLKEPLRRAGLFPDLVVQLMVVGEQTAELDRLLLHAAEHYEQEVDGVVETLTSVIEPVLIVVIGLVLGAILVALYLPMFDLVQVVG